MANAGSVIKGVAPLFKMIPYIGGIAEMGATLAGGALEQSEANRQKEQAEKIRKDALLTKKQQLRPEFLEKKRADEMLALTGLAGEEMLRNRVDEGISNNLRNIQESSRSGASTLNALNAAVNLGNDKKTDIGIADAQAKLAGQKQVSDDLWQIGLQERGLENIRDAQKREGLQAAAQLESDAMMGSLNAKKGMIAGASQGASSLLNSAPELAQISFEQKEFMKGNIQSKLSKGLPLTAAEKAFMQKFSGEFEGLDDDMLGEGPSGDLGGNDFELAPSTMSGQTLSIPFNGAW